MSLLSDLRDKAKLFESNILNNEYVKTIIIENKEFIADMNATDQLYDKGINSLGVNISSFAPYSKLTIEIKKEKGQPYNRVTLYDEGEFHSSFYLEITDEGFEIKASDWKEGKLTQGYGDSILGLTKENINQLIWEYIYPELCKIRDNIFYEK